MMARKTSNDPLQLYQLAGHLCLFLHQQGRRCAPGEILSVIHRKGILVQCLLHRKGIVVQCLPTQWMQALQTF